MNTTLVAMMLGGWELIFLVLLGLILPLTLAGLVGLIIFLVVRSNKKAAPTIPPPTPAAPPVNPPPPPQATQVIPRKCPKCGTDLKPDAPEGLCPACLLQHGFASEGGAPPGTPAFTPPPIPELAKFFPQLEILEMIGQGGMGAVYKARQPSLERYVALKILAPRSGGDLDFSGRFTREARALARLSHPNIVAVHDFGTVRQELRAASGASPEQPGAKPEATGAPILHYFIMEFVDGPNLRQIEQAGKLSPREALQIIPQICTALQFAHDEGIVHRDIKPENVLIDKKGRVKIADFGLAKILGQEPDLRLTGARDVMGTPHYMAPEQVETPQEVDHRADIYSLGVVFYEMLTGELPLGKFDPPSHKVQIDVRLDDVVMRSLSKSPDRRYQHVSQVQTEVETIAQNPSTKGAAAPIAPGAAPTFDVNAIPDYPLHIRSCLGRGWTLVKGNFWPLFGINALVVVLLAFTSSVCFAIASHVPGLQFTSALCLLVSGPLMGGLYLYFLQVIRGQRPTIETLFSGFRDRFLHLFLGSLVKMLLVTLGFFCLILPGIYLSTAWMFTLIIIIDKRMDFWGAMELSRKIITRHWWKFFFFAILLLLLKFVGVLFCVVGLLIAGPIVHAAFLYAYEDIFGARAPQKSAPTAAPPVSTAPSGSGTGKGFGLGAALAIMAVIAIITVITILGLVAHKHKRHARSFSSFTQDRQVMTPVASPPTAENSSNKPAEPQTNIEAIVHIRALGAINSTMVNIRYAAQYPAGYALRATASSGTPHIYTPNGGEGMISWNTTFSFPPSTPGRPPRVTPPPKIDSFEEMQAQRAVIQSQLQALQDQGPIPVGLGKPTRMFSVTNSSGNVWEGFLELVPASTNEQSNAAPATTPNSTLSGSQAPLAYQWTSSSPTPLVLPQRQSTSADVDAPVTNGAAIVQIRNIYPPSVGFVSIIYSAKTPAGYSLQPTQSYGSHLLNDWGDRCQVIWNTSGAPPAQQIQRLRSQPIVPPEQEPLGAEGQVIRSQLDALRDQGPISVAPGKPTRFFSVTNNAGDIWEGFLQLVPEKTNNSPRAESNQDNPLDGTSASPGDHSNSTNPLTGVPTAPAMPPAPDSPGLIDPATGLPKTQ